MYDYLNDLLINWKFFYLYRFDKNLIINVNELGNKLIINFNTNEFLIIDLNNEYFLMQTYRSGFKIFYENLNLFLLLLALNFFKNFEILDIFKEKNLFNTLNNYFYMYLNYFFEKSESSNESIILFKFFIFFVFILLSNMFFFDYYTNISMFIDWYLPVIFGLFIILENLVIITVYIFVYLTGSKQRKILFVTSCEDLINFLILNSRVLLQLVRGIICSTYHDFLRSSLHSLLSDFYLNIEFSSVNDISSLLSTIFLIITITFLMTFATVLMFLQVLFLFLAIWLFTRCWFISFKAGFTANFLKNVVLGE